MPPGSIALLFDKGSLHTSGPALHQWIEDSRRMEWTVPWRDQCKGTEVIDIDA